MVDSNCTQSNSITFIFSTAKRVYSPETFTSDMNEREKDRNQRAKELLHSDKGYHTIINSTFPGIPIVGFLETETKQQQYE